MHKNTKKYISINTLNPRVFTDLYYDSCIFGRFITLMVAYIELFQSEKNNKSGAKIQDYEWYPICNFCTVYNKKYTRVTILPILILYFIISILSIFNFMWSNYV